MKMAKVSHFIIMGMLMVAIIVSIIAYSVAWFATDVATPYNFVIHANGVTYVYVESIVVDNDAALVPAVAMPGAIQEGLPYNVLKQYNESDPYPSYISKVATVTPVKGDFIVFNEGAEEVKVELPKDENGYTLYPVITETGKISWIDENDHSLGWYTSRKPTEWDEDVEVEWNKEADYEPLYDEEGFVIWKDIMNPDIYGDNYSRGQDFWECRMVYTDNSSECTVHVDLGFKASDDGTVNDYYDNATFAVKRIYITKSDEEIPEGVGMGPIYGNSGVTFTEQSEDKLSCSFIMFGSQKFYMHAEVYLMQPDELLDPAILGKDVYMTIAVSVEVTQLGE